MSVTFNLTLRLNYESKVGKRRYENPLNSIRGASLLLMFIKDAPRIKNKLKLVIVHKNSFH